MRIEPLAKTFGTTLIADSDDADVLDQDAAVIVDHYRRSGAVLLRGFSVDRDRFAELTRRLATEFVVNGGATRETVGEDGRTQTVNAGSHLIPLHSEMGYSPFRPEIAFFFCETAPTRGGETMVADGVDLWRALSEETRRTFLDKKVRYRFQGVPLEPLSQLFFGGRSVDRVEEMLRELPNVAFRRNGDGTLDIENTVFAYTKPKHTEALAFANSVIVEDKRTSFEDGTPFSKDLRLYLFQVSTERALMHKWRDSDVLIVDNLRLMHGRAPFVAGIPRRIMVRMGREAF